MSKGKLLSTLAVASLAFTQHAFASSGEVSFTPTGLKLPIMKITIAKADGTDAQALYTCAAGTAAGCLTDLTSQTDLDKIAAAAGSATIRAGSYSILSLSTCAEGLGGSDSTDAYLKGSFSTGGTTYYTDATSSNAAGVSSSISSADFTKVGNWACSTKNVKLNPALEVTDGADLSLKVLVDNSFAAFSTSNNSPGMGGCKAPVGGGRGLCLTYPAMIPVIGTGTATMKHYKITHATTTGGLDDTKANSIVVVAVDGASKPIMAFGRQYYTATSAGQSGNTGPTDAVFGGPTYVTETQFQTFVVNADGTIAFDQGADQDTYAASFSNFSLSDHTGTVKTKSGVAWQYHALPY